MLTSKPELCESPTLVLVKNKSNTSYKPSTFQNQDKKKHRQRLQCEHLTASQLIILKRTLFKQSLQCFRFLPIWFDLLPTDFKRMLLLENLGTKASKGKFPSRTSEERRRKCFTNSQGKENNLFACFYGIREFIILSTSSLYLY